MATIAGRRWLATGWTLILALFLPAAAALAQDGAGRCGELPAAVTEKRAAILAAADGELEGLAALADPAEFTSNYGGEDTLAHWRWLAEQGDDIRGKAKALLALDCTAADVESMGVIYTWPAAVDLPYDALTAAERAAIGAVNGGAIEDMYVEGPEIGYYAGWQLIIAEDGRWLALVAGD